MKNFWVMALASLCVVLASFYAGRMSLDTTSQTSSGKEELTPTSEKRSASRKPRNQSATPRSAILRKSLIVDPSSATSAEGDWVTIPRDEFIKLSQSKYSYLMRLSSSSSSFDKKLLERFGVSEQSRNILNASIREFGKNVYELRNMNAEFKEGEDENEVIVEFGNYDDQLLPHKEKLRNDIRNALGEERSKLFEKVARLDDFFSDGKKMYSNGRLRLTRKSYTVTRNGKEGKKNISFSTRPQAWDEENQKWTGNSSSGSSSPHGDEKEFFTKSGLYPWPEQDIIDE